MERRTGEKVAPLLAGCIAGASSVLVGHPFDSLKTRLQVGKSTSFGKDGFGTVRQLYRGVLPPLLTVGIVQSVNFTFLEMFKSHLMMHTRYETPSEQGFLGRVFVAGGLAGGIITSITVPVGVVKIQQQIATERGMIECARALVQKHGWTALYRGAVPGLVMEVFGRGVYITTYEAVKLLQLDAKDRQAVIRGEHVDTDISVKMIAAACAGSCGWLSVYAVDVTKSRMMLDVSRETFPTWRACILDTWREGGIRRLYRGLGFSLVRASPVAATVLPIYETTRNLLVNKFNAMGL